MPNIRIKDVPEETHAVLLQRASAAHQSLQEYLRSKLIAEASVPTIDELLDRASDRTGGSLSLTDAVSALSDVRDHLSEVVDRVDDHHERVTVIRDGRPAAVLINPDDLAELEESLDVLSDPEALADIGEGDQAYSADDVVRGGEAVRSLREPRRPPSRDSI